LLKQQHIKPLLAYSSIAHMGYLLIVSIVTLEPILVFIWQSALFYLAAYTVANLSIFIIIALIQQQNTFWLSRRYFISRLARFVLARSELWFVDAT